jgi:hypothetical protein
MQFGLANDRLSPQSKAGLGSSLFVWHTFDTDRDQCRVAILFDILISLEGKCVPL